MLHRDRIIEYDGIKLGRVIKKDLDVDVPPLTQLSPEKVNLRVNMEGAIHPGTTQPPDGVVVQISPLGMGQSGPVRTRVRKKVRSGPGPD